MKGFETKIEQAMYIDKNGCNSIYCLQCQFIDGVCRIYSEMGGSSEISSDVKKKVTKYIRKQKLKEIKNDN